MIFHRALTLVNYSSISVRESSICGMSRSVLGNSRAETRLNNIVLKSGMEVKALKSRANSRIEKAQTK